MGQENMLEIPSFIVALSLDGHPLRLARDKIKKYYYIVLEYFVKKFGTTEYSILKLSQYQNMLLGKKKKVVVTDLEIDAVIRIVINARYQAKQKPPYYKPRNGKHYRQHFQRIYPYWLICDVALILFDDAATNKIAALLKNYMSCKQKSQIDDLLSTLSDDNKISAVNPLMRGLLEQYRRNCAFLEKQELRFIVTANISAGKSTLINALIGKSIARTSQAACTGNICYIYSKPFEDKNIHIKTTGLCLDATKDELSNYEWNTQIKIASYFRMCYRPGRRICIIDTPGVNSALEKDQENITRELLRNENYSKSIHVLNAHKLGSEEELEHLKWVSNNLPKEKTVFVINKMDDFRCVDDDIEESIEGVRKDLLALGFENPVICPMSAYAALLAKKKYHGEGLTDDEKREYRFLVEKFSIPTYDLSKYYHFKQVDVEKDNEYISMCKKSGIYGLEKNLLGGSNEENIYYA